MYLIIQTLWNLLSTYNISYFKKEWDIIEPCIFKRGSCMKINPKWTIYLLTVLDLNHWISILTTHSYLLRDCNRGSSANRKNIHNRTENFGQRQKILWD